MLIFGEYISVGCHSNSREERLKVILSTFCSVDKSFRKGNLCEKDSQAQKVIYRNVLRNLDCMFCTFA